MALHFNRFCSFGPTEAPTGTPIPGKVLSPPGRLVKLMTLGSRLEAAGNYARKQTTYLVDPSLHFFRRSPRLQTCSFGHFGLAALHQAPHNARDHRWALTSQHWQVNNELKHACLTFSVRISEIWWGGVAQPYIKHHWVNYTNHLQENIGKQRSCSFPESRHKMMSQFCRSRFWKCWELRTSRAGQHASLKPAIGGGRVDKVVKSRLIRMSKDQLGKCSCSQTQLISC